MEPHFEPGEPGPQTSSSQEASGIKHLRTDPGHPVLPRLRVRTGDVAKGTPGPCGGVPSRSCCFVQESSSTTQPRVGRRDLAAQGHLSQGRSCFSKERCSEKPVLETFYRHIPFSQGAVRPRRAESGTSLHVAASRAVWVSTGATSQHLCFGR